MFGTANIAKPVMETADPSNSWKFGVRRLVIGCRSGNQGHFGRMSIQ
jgi:hypothetical protein